MPLFLRPAFWFVRHTIGPALRRKYVAKGLPSGTPTMRETAFPPGEDAAAAARLQAHTGPVLPSPVFGKMTKDEALQFQLKHCEHHLSFLVPREA